MSTVLIKQIPDDYADSTGLAKYNRSRMPGCKDVFQVAQTSDGRYITGIDEDALDVKKEEKEKVKLLRENLESKTGKNLSATSDFWSNFLITIEADKPKVFNTTNPMEFVALRALIVNKNVAPDKEAAYTPEYREAQYYAYTEESEAQEETSTRKKRDKALGQLLDISENKDKMVLYGQYLEGLKYSSKLGESTLYKMLRAFIEDKDIKNAINFSNVINKPLEELQQKIIVDKALKQRLIARVSLGGKKHIYQYGQITLGNTVEEVYKNLSLPDFAPELMALKKELENR